MRDVMCAPNATLTPLDHSGCPGRHDRRTEPVLGRLAIAIDATIGEGVNGVPRRTSCTALGVSGPMRDFSVVREYVDVSRLEAQLFVHGSAAGNRVPERRSMAHAAFRSARARCIVCAMAKA